VAAPDPRLGEEVLGREPPVLGRVPVPVLGREVVLGARPPVPRSRFSAFFHWP
jgi:hypothetical protein